MASTHKACPACGGRLSEQEIEYGFCSIECSEKHRDKVWRLTVDLKISRRCLEALTRRCGNFLKKRERILSELRLLGNEWTSRPQTEARDLIEIEERRCQKAWLKADATVTKLSDACATARQRTNELELELGSTSKVLEG